jgi:hypothetical protein
MNASHCLGWIHPEGEFEVFTLWSSAIQLDIPCNYILFQLTLVRTRERELKIVLAVPYKIFIFYFRMNFK